MGANLFSNFQHEGDASLTGATQPILHLFSTGSPGYQQATARLRRTMRTQSLVIAIALAGAALPASALGATLTYGPILGRGATPDKMIVHWGTDSTAGNNVVTVQYRPSGSTSAQTVNATRVCSANSGANCDYEATIGGLALASDYEYSVAGNAIDGSQHFGTCPAPGAPLDVVFYGDSRSGGTQHQIVAGHVLASGPDIVFESGDIQYGGIYSDYFATNDESSGQPGFFVGAKALVASVPFMAVPGNHDASSNMPTNYGLLFPNPGHVVGSSGWTGYYSFTCGDSMFIGLDANTPNSTQTSWLTAQLAAAKSNAAVVHVFVWFHQSPYSIGTHGDDATTQPWTPLFEDPASKVRAVFTGHDHDYQRLQHGGLTYIVSGGAGADLYPVATTDKAGASVLAKTAQFNYVQLHITPALVTGGAFDGSTGNPLNSDLTGAPDTFTLYSSGAGGGGGSGGGGGMGGGGGSTGGGGGTTGGGGGTTGGGGGTTGSGGGTTGGGNGGGSNGTDNGGGGMSQGGAGGCSMTGEAGAQASAFMMLLALAGLLGRRYRRSR
jgi:MYXO-CTERM domain-containing protein